jgi:hypothetical protein
MISVHWSSLGDDPILPAGELERALWFVVSNRLGTWPPRFVMRQEDPGKGVWRGSNFRMSESECSRLVESREVPEQFKESLEILLEEVTTADKWCSRVRLDVRQLHSGVEIEIDWSHGPAATTTTDVLPLPSLSTWRGLKAPRNPGHSE